MRRTNRRRIVRPKRVILLTLSLVIIGTGIWFTTTNAYKFLLGYLAFKVEQVSAEPSQTEGAPEEPEAKLTNKAAIPQKTKTAHAETDLYPERPETGDEIGTLAIPKLNATLPIYHGTDEDELEKGVGHFAGSVLPGEHDNSVLSGHRDTVFRKLGEVGEGDTLVVTTSAGEFTYKVRKVRIVDADDRTVIVPKPRPTLTVTTCYPFDFIGSAPERYVLVANLIESKLD